MKNNKHFFCAGSLMGACFTFCFAISVSAADPLLVPVPISPQLTEKQKLTADDTAPGDRFGVAVALSNTGRIALIGAPTRNYSSGGLGLRYDGTSCGAAYVFVRVTVRPGVDRYRQHTKLVAASDPRNEFCEGFGVSVALSGNGRLALVGAPKQDCADGTSCGAAYVFTRSGDEWQLQQKLTASDAMREDEFGQAVALSGNGTTALVGAPDAKCVDDRFGRGTPSCGAAYVFIFSGGTWTQQQKFGLNRIAEPSGFGARLLSLTMATGPW
jgi:FG-GAP repeat